ncbi:MAG: RNA methyltransferase [Desulfobacterales bacterium]
MDLSIALIHYPVLDKYGQTIASAITNLDLHDIARCAKTYGIVRFYVVTPLCDQQVLAHKIIDHWTEGFGGKYNPHRKEAVELIRIADSLELVVDDIRRRRRQEPKMVVTSARQFDGSIGHKKLKQMISGGEPYLLLFGTAWGISNELMSRADYFLKPIAGTGEYNHLSVRSASAVILDRLLARNE